MPCKQLFLLHKLCICVCVCVVCRVIVSALAFNVLTVSLTCSLMLLIPSDPNRLTACFTRSVRPQLSIRKPRSCRNFASVEAASSFLEKQKQSSVLKGKANKVITVQAKLFSLFTMHHIFPEQLMNFIFLTLQGGWNGKCTYLHHITDL